MYILFAVRVCVWNCQKVTDATAAALSAECPELSMLCMSKCDSITDDALTALSRGCPKLTFVTAYTFTVCLFANQ